jgi:FkbM family methyltransferase
MSDNSKTEAVSKPTLAGVERDEFGKPKILAPLGFEIIEVDGKKYLTPRTRVGKETGPADLFSFDPVFQRLADRGIEINTIIDVGASNSCWSEKVIHYFPDAHYLMVEAQLPHEPGLKAFVQRFPGQVEYVLAAAGASEGELYFNNENLFGGIASTVPFANNNISVRSIRLDEEVKRRGLKGPFFLKLDTHGYEVPILEGYGALLAETNLLLVETYNFRLARETGLFFYEFCKMMDEKGFRCIDMLEPLHRPHDQLFWQVDLIFARKDRPEFAYTGYH